MNPAVIYHLWAEQYDQPPYRNLRCPAILSIATFRANNPDIPIYVLDCTDYNQDWQNYPETLNFKVIRWSHKLREYHHRQGWRHLSRMFDVQAFADNLPNETIVYTDTDTMWLKPLLPLARNPDKFCFDKYNSGFYYFNKNSSIVKKYFELFKAYTITGLNDDNFRFLTRQYIAYNEWYYLLDEAMMAYMFTKMPELFEKVPLHEHFLINSPMIGELRDFDFKKVKMIHLNGISILDKDGQHARGLACLMVKELYDLICPYFTKHQMSEIFGEELSLLKGQVSLFDRSFLESVEFSRDQAGLVQLRNIIENNEPVDSAR